jgi:hypothetical protein
VTVRDAANDDDVPLANDRKLDRHQGLRMDQPSRCDAVTVVTVNFPTFELMGIWAGERGKEKGAAK